MSCLGNVTISSGLGKHFHDKEYSLNPKIKLEIKRRQQVNSVIRRSKKTDSKTTKSPAYK